MPKKVTYTISMKDGTKGIVTGTEVVPGYAYDKRCLTMETTVNSRGEEKTTKTYTYVLTHIPTGTLITSSDKVAALKLLCTEPEFFDEFNPVAIIKALQRFWNKYDWQDSKIKVK